MPAPSNSGITEERRRYFEPLQAKLTVSQPDDPLEREADDVANAVLRMEEPTSVDTRGGGAEPHGASAPIQRMCAECSEEEKIQRAPMDQEEPAQAEAIEAPIQEDTGPQEDAEEEEQTAGVSVTAVLPGVAPAQEEGDAAQVTAIQQSGAPLPDEVRGFFEPRFGVGFSHVRVHTDEQAAASARSLNARAYTVGSDVVFGAGEYSPGSAEGQKLLAHELTHVVQQGGGGPTRISRQGKDTPKPKPPAKQPPAKNAAPPASGVTEQQVQVLPDKTGPTKNPAKDAETEIKLNLEINFSKSKKDGKITKFSGTVSKTIQSTFKPGANPDGASGYGRGTTDADKTAGNTSLRFHEHSHTGDFQTYMSQHKLPEFTGKVGMTEKEFKDAVDKYKAELKQYKDDMERDSKNQTDCVGKKESSCP